MTIEANYPDAASFIAALNKVRLDNPQQWIFYTGTVADKTVSLKTYGHTYLQQFTIDGAAQKTPSMDCKVSAWKLAITDAFEGMN
jgi:hypothetical protein